METQILMSEKEYKRLKEIEKKASKNTIIIKHTWDDDNKDIVFIHSNKKEALNAIEQRYKEWHKDVDTIENYKQTIRELKMYWGFLNRQLENKDNFKLIGKYLSDKLKNDIIRWKNDIKESLERVGLE